MQEQSKPIELQEHNEITMRSDEVAIINDGMTVKSGKIWLQRTTINDKITVAKKILTVLTVIRGRNRRISRR